MVFNPPPSPASLPPSGPAGGLLGGNYPSPTSAAGNLLVKNADVDPAAAIAKTKLAALAIVNADIAGAAAIALSKLASTPLSSGAGAGQYQAVRTGSQAFTGLANTLVTITWPSAFADTNYTVVVNVVEESAGGGNLATNPAGEIKNKLAGSCQVSVNNGNAGNINGHLEAIAIHD